MKSGSYKVCWITKYFKYRKLKKRKCRRVKICKWADNCLLNALIIIQWGRFLLHANFPILYLLIVLYFSSFQNQVGVLSNNNNGNINNNNSQDEPRRKKHEASRPNHILLFTILNPLYPITVVSIQHYHDDYGYHNNPSSKPFALRIRT